MIPKHILAKGYAYFITTNVKNNIPIFKDDSCCQLLINDLDYYRKELEFILYGYVIMPTHLHLIIHPSEKTSIALVMKKIKGHSSYPINKYLNQKGSLWQEDYFEHIIRNKLDFKEKVDYIHKNPVKAGLVENMKEYKYSSYRNYYFGDESIIRIDFPRY